MASNYPSPADLRKQARAAAAAEIAGARVPIDQSAADAAAKNAAHGQAIEGFSSALAQVLAGIQPNVEQPYDQAATRTATFAKGYSDGLQLKSQGAADQTNSFLTNVVGAPAGQLVSPDTATAAGDAAYGFGGYIPASSLEREGAAYSAAAALLPAYARLRGQQDFTSNIFAGNDLQKTYAEQIAQLLGQKPKLINDLYDQLQQQTVQKRATDVNQAIAIAQLTGEVTPEAAALLGIPKGTKTAQAKAAAAAAGAPDAALSKLFGYVVNSSGNPLTGKDGKLVPIKGAATAGPKANASLSKALGYLVDDSGNTILRNGKPVKLPKAVTKPTNPLGLSSKDYQKYNSLALGAARNYHSTWTDADGQQQDPLSWQQFLTHGEAAGIPVAILIKQGKKVYSAAERRQGLIPGGG